METPKEYYYTYYSYEEWGRGYFGSRKCYCLPEEDMNYLGSSKDKTFRPTQKIILKSDYATREEAIADEIILQRYYKVVENSHFANKAYQTSTKFSYIPSTEEASRNGKKGSEKIKENGLGIFALTQEQLSENGKLGGEKGGKKSKELGLGIHGQTIEELLKNCSKGGQKAKELGLGVHGRTKEQIIKDSKKGAQKAKELGVGFFAMSKEQRIKNGIKSGNKTYNLKIGLFSLTKEQLQENGKKTSSQKWKCLETGYISSPAGLSNYQRARKIDTSQRIRVE